MAKRAAARHQHATAEHRRLAEDESRASNWKRWGPYLAERQWGTVREDYSPDGECWTYFPHEHARSRAYRWGEDGLLGFTDRECRLCFGLALWNERDPILKERLFGLVNSEGNHGEDAKECYYYLDSTPTHSYAKALYKYPQSPFPYAELIRRNREAGKHDDEFELADTGVFDGNRYFDVFAEYAKAGPDDVLVRITIANRGDAPARIHVLPTIWFRNTWVWGCKHEGCTMKPRLERHGPLGAAADHETLGHMRFEWGAAPDGSHPELLFTDNHTNQQKLWGVENHSPWTKDAFHEYVIAGRREAVHPKHHGTKAAAHYALTIPAGGDVVLRARLFSPAAAPVQPFGPEFESVFADRIREADDFYAATIPAEADAPRRAMIRQAYAGLLWTKQFFHYVVEDWLQGDPDQPPPPASRLSGRNSDWSHVYARDVISMPDKWEYPWFAAWDLAFHMIPFADVDPLFAKQQLALLLREWYMHPNGQIPAYEFAFGDVNPPVHAWACWRLYKMTGPRGQRDIEFLERVFHKLLMNFTWWVNRKDPRGKNIFAGGFLGLDNIGVFDRSQPLPTGGHLEQADGTAWMAFYCGTMMSMALELAKERHAYEDIASKFFEHFVAIADAMNHLGDGGLWDEEDGFYYDQIFLGGQAIPLKVRSMVGLIPLFACELLEDAAIEQLPGFKKRMDWFLENRRDLHRTISYMEKCTTKEGAGMRLLAIPTRDRLERILRYVFAEDEFLSPHGVRSLSRVHAQDPYVFRSDGREWRVEYEPAESRSWLFGGNSNWRGPIWFPMNYLLIEALERYHHFFGDTFRVEFPAGSGSMVTLKDAAADISRRLTGIFLPDKHGRRPVHGLDGRYTTDPHWRDLVLFYEFFDGDTGRGCGASHQTGWTALVAKLAT